MKSALRTITAESFAPYGRVLEFTPEADNRSHVVITEDQEPWRLAVFRCRNHEADCMEAHPTTLESFEPRSGISVLLAARPESPEHPEAFLPDRAVCLYKGVWHQVLALTGEAQCVIAENLEVPGAALPSVEVLYNDGSPSGYFEALLAMELPSALPYARFAQKRRESCVFCPPARFKSEWECYIDLPDWRPRLIEDGQSGTLYLCWRHFEDGFGSSDGRDRIYLAQHSFFPNLTAYHAFAPGDPHSMYRSQLNTDPQYGETRRCCAASVHRILLARERP